MNQTMATTKGKKAESELLPLDDPPGYADETPSLHEAAETNGKSYCTVLLGTTLKVTLASWLIAQL